MITSEMNDVSIDFSQVDGLIFQSIASVGLGDGDDAIAIVLSTGVGLDKQTISLSFTREQLVQLSQEVSIVIIGLEEAKADA